MKYTVMENTWLDRALQTKLSIHDHGWGNGYVFIPKQRPLWEKSYDEIHDLYPELDVHCGLTFAEHIPPTDKWKEVLPEGLIGDEWVVGFDTAHSYDNLDKWPKEAVIEETKRLAEQLEDYKKPTDIFRHPGWTDLQL